MAFSLEYAKVFPDHQNNSFLTVGQNNFWNKICIIVSGVVSGAMLLIEDDPKININTEWTELIVSATVGAAWLFSLIGGPCNEIFGRKPTILIAR